MKGDFIAHCSLKLYFTQLNTEELLMGAYSALATVSINLRLLKSSQIYSSHVGSSLS